MAGVSSSTTAGRGISPYTPNVVHADTEGLLDKCHCGAVAGFEHLGAFDLRARCTECCEQTGIDHHVQPVMIEWNNARRAEKEKAKQ